ncbi:hypothetical protein [Parachitinimonas caeni]|uniref:Uncharacterized protein n=1 Tax=Parachitinimonas caeni TaxID=3031301 RepID=A0ABT7DUY3_9NEIS|nr:hypothetical protein [Parachitinimonas caeni]MDK2123870.1 hypothetical protein [Parachitinimonas caeni]
MTFKFAPLLLVLALGLSLPDVALAKKHHRGKPGHSAVSKKSHRADGHRKAKRAKSAKPSRQVASKPAKPVVVPSGPGSKPKNLGGA